MIKHKRVPLENTEPRNTSADTETLAAAKLGDKGLGDKGFGAAKLGDEGLVVESLRVDRLGQAVVREVDLSVAPGEVTVLLGANGAGKSTLLDGISGVIPASGGRVLLNGIDITRSSRRNRVKAGLAYVQQGRTVFPSLTVEENFLVAASPEHLQLAFDLFPELRVRRSVAAGCLSGGEQQMVVLGRAVLRPPRVLMIDELSLGLAPAVIDRMMVALKQMTTDGIGLLLVEQFTERALAAANNAVVIARGQVVLRGSASQIQDQPDRLQSAYLATAEVASPDVTSIAAPDPASNPAPKLASNPPEERSP